MAKDLAESWVMWMLMGLGCYSAGVGTGALVTLWICGSYGRFRCYYREWAEQIKKRD